jgi:hypothetical protein
MREYHHRRSRANRTRGDLLTLAYCVGDLCVFELVKRADGVHIRLTCDPSRVGGADKERAADWLRRTHLPALTHDQAFDRLWKPPAE